VSASLDRAAAAAARRPGHMSDVPRARVRLYAMPVMVAGKRAAVVVSGVSMDPYETSRRLALIGSLALAVAIVAVLGLLTRWALGAALRPVAEMTADAEAWSVQGTPQDAPRRFAVGEPRDELGQLAATLDRLLDRLSASLRREQRFSAELSHELRTPLARVCTEAELALRRQRQPAAYQEALRAVLDGAKSMSRTIDTLVAAQRQESGLAHGTSDAHAVLAEAAAACDGLAVSRGVVLAVTDGRSAATGSAAANGPEAATGFAAATVSAAAAGPKAATVSASATGPAAATGPAEAAPNRHAPASAAVMAAPASGIQLGVDAEVALRILQPLVENACQCAERSVTLGVERRASEVLLTVDDDGPGVLPDECELIFEPGVRGSVTQDYRAFAGAGLGLALSRRLARAASGDVTARADTGGGHFEVRLPAG
jgi:signal transduction histidine kinase